MSASGTSTTATTTRTSRTTAIHCPARLGMPTLLHPRERPARVLGEQLVAAGGVALDGSALTGAAHVAGRDEGVSLQPPTVVCRHVEAFVARAQLPAVRLEPVDQRNRRLGARAALPPLLDAAIPGTDVLADVAAVHHRPELGAVALGNRRGRLRPVGQTQCGVEPARLVERPG